MVLKGYDWKSELANLFAASVNQQTLEEAVELMVSVSSVDRDYHEECMQMLESGIEAAKAGDSSVMDCINRSGYRVLNLGGALELLEEFRMLYMEAYRASCG